MEREGFHVSGWKISWRNDGAMSQSGKGHVESAIRCGLQFEIEANTLKQNSRVRSIVRHWMPPNSKSVSEVKTSPIRSLPRECFYPKVLATSDAYNYGLHTLSNSLFPPSSTARLPARKISPQ